MQKSKYNKPALSVIEQIKLLKSRGLIIPDEKLAINFLSNVTYYRLSSYMKYFQINDSFKLNTTFLDIVELYNFDTELRTLIFKYLELVEIKLRTKICLHMCSNYGPHWFLEKENFKTKENYNNTIQILTDELKLKKDTFIKYYFKKYNEPHMPPFWTMSEVLSMGDLSKILSSLNFKDIKKIASSINENYYISKVIVNWFHVLTTIRNICAHHSRLWNRQLKIKFLKPNKIKSWEENNIKIDKVSALYFVISILLDDYQSDNFKQEFNDLLLKYPKINKTQMGFD